MVDHVKAERRSIEGRQNIYRVGVDGSLSMLPVRDSDDADGESVAVPRTASEPAPVISSEDIIAWLAEEGGSR